MSPQRSTLSRKVGSLLLLFILAATTFVAAAPVVSSQDVYARAGPSSPKPIARKNSIKAPTTPKSGSRPGSPAPKSGTPSPSHPDFGTSQCPSVSDFATLLRVNMAPRPQGPIVFYTKPANAQNAATRAEMVQGWSYTSIGGTDLTMKWAGLCNKSPPESNRIAPRISVALATVASKIAWVVTSGEPNLGSIWIQLEMPTLQRNPAIDMIKRFDLITQKETVIWKKGDPLSPLGTIARR